MKGLLLLSSGIDSPVAGKLMADKGVEVVALHFDFHPDEKEEKKVIELAKKIEKATQGLVTAKELRPDLFD